jgi:transcriptional regulator with XRE-family HTH domain
VEQTSYDWRRISARLGASCRDARERLALTQEAVAAIAELHPNYYGRLERGEENPTLEVLVKVAQALSVRLSDLFTEV